VALAVFHRCLKVSAPQQFFGNCHDLIRLEAELFLKLLERRCTASIESVRIVLIAN
jgi:hypothetical protein